MSKEAVTILTPREIQQTVHKKILRHQYIEYGYGLDPWFFALHNAEPPTKDEIVSFTTANRIVNQKLSQGARLAYWSGGFDLGIHHHDTIALLDEFLPKDVEVVISAETDNYIRAKGREPEFNQTTRLNACATLLKKYGKLAVGFPMPERPDSIPPNEFYTDIVTKIGMYRTEGSYHLYTNGYPFVEDKIARMLKPEIWCCLPVSWWIDKAGSSTTEQLNMKVDR